MQNIQLTTTQWLALPHETRMKLREVFHIPRSEGTIMQDNKVLSDGYNHRDLSVISIAAMQGYLGDTPDAGVEFYALFDRVLDKIHADTIQAPDETPVQAVPEVVFTFNGKLYRATEIGDAPKDAVVQSLYPTAPAEVAKPKLTRAPRKKAKK